MAKKQEEGLKKFSEDLKAEFIKALEQERESRKEELDKFYKEKQNYLE